MMMMMTTKIMMTGTTMMKTLRHNYFDVDMISLQIHWCFIFGSAVGIAKTLKINLK